MGLYKLIGPILFMLILVGLITNSASFNDSKSNRNDVSESSVYGGILQKKIDDNINAGEILDFDSKKYDIVKVAYKEIGNVGGEKYWGYFGFNTQTSWCACFVSWCADQCGLIDEKIIPKFTSVGYGYSYFVSEDQWLSGSNTPEPGMIVFFDFTNAELDEIRDGIPDHVGIVKDVKDGYVYCIEGNYRNTCKETKYAIGHKNILGYGTPKY